MYKKNHLLVALFASLTFSANALAADTGIDLQANQAHIRTQQNSEAISHLPKDLKLAVPGKFTVAIAALNSPPLALFADDNKTLIGSESDFAQLVADSLGLQLNIVPTSWEDWPLGVASGKYDAAITNVTVTKDRKAKFDFATYRIDSLGFYVKSTNKITAINQASDIAGLKIIVSSGTNQESILLAWDKENQQKGLPAILPIYVTDDAAANLALQSGRADAYFGPNVMGAYKAKLTGKTKLVGKVDGGWPKVAHIAVTTKKGNGLVTPINIALNGVIKGGEYDQVLNRWGENVERIDRSEINPAGLGD
ncbi:ABC transporter substrate-binding protein [Edaphovirga cremea]|uniref:ABC transporter substrate-binding protein n=1 Tax=Edaphovirga cremea TaxID=2267246 RepID=UPI000DEF76B8|nr:ABC transporter substrate-binding protein [Edaphovirga cremea]